MAFETHDLSEPLNAIFEKLGLPSSDLVFELKFTPGAVTVQSYIGKKVPDGQADLECRTQTFRYRWDRQPAEPNVEGF